jgi:hypothetical protein
MEILPTHFPAEATKVVIAQAVTGKTTATPS